MNSLKQAFVTLLLYCWSMACVFIGERMPTSITEDWQLLAVIGLAGFAFVYAVTPPKATAEEGGEG